MCTVHNFGFVLKLFDVSRVKTSGEAGFVFLVEGLHRPTGGGNEVKNVMD